MASRGLSAAAITELQSSPVRFFNLIRIDFSTPLYYTDAPYDITYDDGDGSQTYVSSAILSNFPDIPESVGIKPSTHDIHLTGTLAVHALEQTEDYKHVPVYIHHYLSGDASGTIKFKGSISEAESVEIPGKNKSTVTFTVTSHWNNWKAQNGRYISKDSHNRLSAGDDFFEFTGVTDRLEDFWGQVERKPNTRGGLFGIVRSVHNFIHGTGTQPAGTRSGVLADKLANGIYNFENQTAAAEKLPVAYGRCATQGTRIFRDVSGTKNEYMWAVYALSEGACDSLTGDKIQFDGVAYDNAQFNGKIDYAFYKGTNSQTESSAPDEGSDLTNVTATKLRNASSVWDTNNRDGSGICYCIIRYNYDSTIFDSFPEPVFILQGRAVHTGVSDNYTANSAWILRDYLSNSTYGKGISTSDIVGISDAATYCDTAETENDGGAGTIALFEFNGLIDTSIDIKNNIETILFSMRGNIAWVGGDYKLIINRDDTTISDSVYSFNESNIDIDKPFGYKKLGGNLLNLVEYEFIDPLLGYSSDIVFSDSATYLAEDNGIELKAKVSNKYEINRFRAQNRSTTILKESRLQKHLSFHPALADAITVECGDIIDVTRSEKGWTNKLFRVLEMMLLSNGWVIFTNVKEFDPSSYDWEVPADVTLPSDTTLINPFDLTSIVPSSCTAATGTVRTADDGTTLSRLKITVGLPTSSKYISYLEVQVQETNDASTEWTTLAQLDPDGDLITYHEPAVIGVTYTARVRSVNSLGKVSAWVTSSDHKLTGAGIIGYDVRLDATNGYNQDAYYFHTYFEALDHFTWTPSGNFTIDNTGVTVARSGTLTTFARTADISNVNLTYAKDRRFRAVVTVSNFGRISGNDSSCSIGGYSICLSFKLDWNDSTSKIDITGYSRSWATSSETTAVIASVDNGDTITLECVFTEGVGAEFIVNDTDSETNTTYYPDSSDDSVLKPERILHYSVGNQGDSTTLLFKEFQFLQLP